MSQKKVPTFENSELQDYSTDLNHSNSSEKPKDQSIFVIFLAVLPALEVRTSSTLYEFHRCKMIEKGPKTSNKS